MAVQVKNVTKQRIPVIVPDGSAGTEVILAPQKTVVFALDKPTPQMLTLKKKGLLKIK